MQDLEANTAATILIGPAVAVADGVTPVTDVSLAGADHAELMKHNGTVFVDLTSDSRTFTHKEGGWYTLVLGTGDVDTEGRLTVLIMDTDKCLPMWKDFMVLSQAAWASKYGAKDTGYADVNVKAIGDTATPETSGKLHVLNGDGAAIVAAGPTKAQMDAALLIMKQKAAGTFNRETDSLEAIRDRGDAAWVTGSGGDATLAKQNLLIQILTGKWEITGNQLIMYDSDGTTPLYTFDLKQDGTATEYNPDERTPV